MPNETIISQVLLSLLEKYDYVDVPGLGRFSFTYISASLDDTSHEIYPPIRSLQLDTGLHGDRNIYELLSRKKSGKEVSKVKSRIHQFVNELINLGCTEIPGFATIAKQENGRIEIVDIDPAIGGYRQYLPALTLTPKDHTYVDFKKVDTAAAFANDSKKFPLKESANWQPYLLPLIFLAVSMVAIVLFWKSCMVGDYQDRQTANTEVVDDIEEMNATKGDTTAALFSNKNVGQYRDVLTADLLRRGCTIVVGSFSDRNRAVQRASQVRSYGYDIDDVPYEAPFRVIIRFDCSRNDLKDFLAEVRNKVDASSWYLEPEGFDPFD